MAVLTLNMGYIHPTTATIFSLFPELLLSYICPMLSLIAGEFGFGCILILFFFS
jgi:hypothetical protein